jgi:ParB-like chromosome segregation protein Spo0J
MSEKQEATVYEIMQQTRPGSQDHTWVDEFDEIDDRLFSTPIQIGTDHRIIDGHHRIRLAHALGLIDKLPYEIVDMEDKDD